MINCRFAFAAAGLLIGAATVFAQPPANANFDNRAAVSGSSASFSGNLTGSTLELGEPPLPPLGTNASDGSLWWTWTAPTSSPVVISILRDYSTGLSLNAALEVFS